MKFEIKNLSCGYDKKVVIENFNANLQDGDIFCLLGSNGVGKTTTFKTILGFLKPLGGEILIDGKDALKMSEKERASFISYVPQAHTPPFAFSVFDVVMMSANARLGIFERPSKEDEKIALDALKTLNLESFKGGERQMVLIARALAQRSKVMLLDEPTANLDFGNHLKEIKKLAKQGYIIILTSRQPEQVFYLNAKVAMLGRDKNYIYGEASEVMNGENLKKIYGVDIRVVKNIIDEREHFSCVMVD
ncbi:ABC transporter ATP-binding protein [Campylobacter concisus]|uniref:ABC transporter ATP-binding protein n=1 Tax=Campylobacter concisus TaxID=199 RepID=UPI000A029EE6|nr:ABC transporter ATP-binding protein [Campylobacter concisus]ORI04031.1 iron ABC transporter ATP-binding protein [Campylobacter concisus]